MLNLNFLSYGVRLKLEVNLSSWR